MFAGQVLSETAKALMEDPKRLDEAKEELKKRMAGKPYVCPIPKGEGSFARRKKGDVGHDRI